MKIKDGAATPNELTIKIGDGNLTYSEKRNMEYLLDRGVIDEVREGDDVPMDINFTFNWEYIKGALSTTGSPSVEDALKQIGAAANWTSTDSDACRPYAVDIEITYEPNCSSSDKETITLPDFRWESFDHDPRAGQITCAGKCNAKYATTVRAAQST
jgi:hypothetical protein